MDLAHFASETWLQERFYPKPSLSVSVNWRVAVALFRSYRLNGGALDTRRIACYVGAYVICYLDYADWTADMALKRQVAREGLALMLGSDNSHADTTDDPMLRLLFNA